MRNIFFLVLAVLIAGVCFSTPMQWIEDSSVAAKVRVPRCIFRGMLVGGGGTEIAATGNGIYLQKDYVCLRGGKLFNATANNNTMVGIDDVGLFALSTVSGVLSVEKSATGFSDFANALVPANGLRGVYLSSRQLIDCGRHTISGTEKRVLLFCEYATSADAGDYKSRIWMSAEATDANAGNTGTWALLFGAVDCGAIRHWHGGTYVKNKGLYLWAGDDGKEASVLFCAEADMGTFLASPATWYASDHWALENAAARSGWTANYKSAHVLLGYTEQARVCDMVTANGRVAYYIPDREPIVGVTFTSQNIIKVDMYDTTDSAAGTISILASGLSNIGYMGGASKSGMVYLSTLTKRDGNNVWYPGHNGQVEIYAIDPENEQWARVKTVTPWNLKANQPYTCAVLNEYGGAMFARIGGVSAIQSTDEWSDAYIICGKVEKQKRPATNILTNGSFAEAFDTAHGWTAGSATNVLVVNGGLAAGIVVGDTVTGHTSAATGVVASLTIFASTFASEADDDKLTLPAAFFADGDKVRISAGLGSVLPGGTNNSTDYYVRDVDGPTIKLETSVGGGAINLTSDGSGTYRMIRKYSNVAATDNAANFASNTALGWVRLSSVSGLFSADDEKLYVSGTERANLIGFSTREIIADPTGEIGGNVLRVAVKSVTFEYTTYINPALTATQKALLVGNVVTFSCKTYIPTASVVAGVTVQPQMVVYPSSTSLQTRFASADLEKNIWRTWDCTGYVPTTATTHLYYFLPNAYYNSGVYTLYYVTDFQLVVGAIRNDEIKQLGIGSSGGVLLGGSSLMGN